MKESEGKRKEAGTAKRFPPNLLMSQKHIPRLQCNRSLYTALAKKNYKKNQNQKLLQGIKWEENQKKGNKIQQVKRAAGWSSQQGEQCRR